MITILEKSLVSDMILSWPGAGPAGVIRNGVPFVPKTFRGHGIGARMVRASDVFGEACLNPSHFSVSGLGARVAAHRMHVSHALGTSPENVPLEVRRQYENRDDAVKLVRPWGPAEQARLVAEHLGGHLPRAPIDGAPGGGRAPCPDSARLSSHVSF